MQTWSELRRHADFFKIAGDPYRAAVLCLIADGPLSVGAIVNRILADYGRTVTQPNLSHHLALMRASGVIEDGRRGKENHYSLTPLGARLYALLAPAATPEHDHEISRAEGEGMVAR